MLSPCCFLFSLMDPGNASAAHIRRWQQAIRIPGGLVLEAPTDGLQLGINRE